MNPRVAYNRKAHIGAVGPSPWAKLGPEKWFDAYVIACANTRNYKAPYIIDLGVKGNGGKALSTQAIVKSDAFLKLAHGELADYRFLIYKPITIPPSLDARRIIANPRSFSRFENKRVFREVFAGRIPIPEFRVAEISTLLADDPAKLYRDFSKELGSSFVMQHEQSAGGRGTFIVRSTADVAKALDVLATEFLARTCVISRFVAGTERSIQVFVSETHIVPGPLQQQLVRNVDLLNPDQRGGMFFCGGKLVWDTPESVRQQIAAIVHEIGQRLQREGYKGVFGVDFLVDEAGRVFVLEINARTTGLLPLINEQQTELPLYLLHILELAGERYEITTSTNIPEVPTEGPQTFLILFNKNKFNAFFDKTITTGNYQLSHGELVKLDDNPRWHPEADVLLQLLCTTDSPSWPNLKLCNIFLKETGFDEKGVLTDKAKNVIAQLKEHIRQA